MTPAPTNQHAVLTPAINQAPLNITGPTANLTVTKTTSTPVVINTGAAGMQAIYTTTVSNSISKCAATGVTVTDVLPTGFTYASTGAITFTGPPHRRGGSGERIQRWAPPIRPGPASPYLAVAVLR